MPRQVGGRAYANVLEEEVDEQTEGSREVLINKWGLEEPVELASEGGKDKEEIEAELVMPPWLKHAQLLSHPAIEAQNYGIWSSNGASHRVTQVTTEGVPPQHRGPEVLWRRCISIEDPADSVSLSDRRLWTGECAQSRAKVILGYLGSLNSHFTL